MEKRISTAIAGKVEVTLQRAVLVYSGDGHFFASVHEAFASDDGPPTLGPGEPVTTGFLRSLSGKLAMASDIEIFPENLLVRTSHSIVWWTPPVSRKMYFNCGDEAVNELSGKMFPHPALVWAVSGSELFLRAIRGGVRPHAGTPLCVAPYWNVEGAHGRVCVGSMRRPSEPSVGTIAGWEEGFHQSAFTHQNGAKSLTAKKGGLVSLWKRIQGSSPYPDDLLVDAGETLSAFAGGL